MATPLEHPCAGAGKKNLGLLMSQGHLIGGRRTTWAFQPTFFPSQESFNGHMPISAGGPAFGGTSNARAGKQCKIGLGCCVALLEQNSNEDKEMLQVPLSCWGITEVGMGKR